MTFEQSNSVGTAAAVSLACRQTAGAAAYPVGRQTAGAAAVAWPTMAAPGGTAAVSGSPPLAETQEPWTWLGLRGKEYRPSVKCPGDGTGQEPQPTAHRSTQR